MTKSDFRAKSSLSADLLRLESSLIKNQKELDKSFSTVSTMLSGLQNENKIPNVIEFRDSISTLTTSIRDHIDFLEDDLTGLEGLDLLEFKTSPDDVIISLRKCSDNVKTLYFKIEETLKLITKAKGNGMFKDEIEESKKSVDSYVGSSKEFLDEINKSVNLLLDEISHFKSHSKDLLQQKIL